MKPLSDEALKAAAQLLIDATGDEVFYIAELMLFNMLKQRILNRNSEKLERVKS